MEAFLLTYSSALRTTCMFSSMVIVAVWEVLAPRREAVVPVALRWFGNVAMAVLNTLVVYLVFPVLTVGMALVAHERGWGLLNMVSVPIWVSSALTMLVLDAAFYAQHRLLHELPILWRLHRVHHADPDYDFTTAFRFHLLEGLFTTGFDVAVVAALGPPVPAVVFFEVLYAVQVNLAHGNVWVPLALDGVLRLAIVTPDMHRVHHSETPRETNANFGGILPLWDHLCRTYCAQPAAGHERMTIGLSQYQDRKYLTLPWMLVLPFLPLRSRPTATSGDRAGQGRADGC